MTITGYNPVFYTNDLDSTLNMYKELGFTQKHSFEEGEMKYRVLEINGCRVDVFSNKLHQTEDGFFGMRVNVREFDEAVEYYKDHGYDQVVMETVHTPSSVHICLMNNRNERVLIFYHISK